MKHGDVGPRNEQEAIVSIEEAPTRHSATASNGTVLPSTLRSLSYSPTFKTDWHFLYQRSLSQPPVEASSDEGYSALGQAFAFEPITRTDVDGFRLDQSQGLPLQAIPAVLNPQDAHSVPVVRQVRNASYEGVGPNLPPFGRRTFSNESAPVFQLNFDPYWTAMQTPQPSPSAESYFRSSPLVPTQALDFQDTLDHDQRRTELHGIPLGQPACPLPCTSPDGASGRFLLNRSEGDDLDYLAIFTDNEVDPDTSQRELDTSQAQIGLDDLQYSLSKERQSFEEIQAPPLTSNGEHSFDDHGHSFYPISSRVLIASDQLAYPSTPGTVVVSSSGLHPLIPWSQFNGNPTGPVAGGAAMEGEQSNGRDTTGKFHKNNWNFSSAGHQATFQSALDAFDFTGVVPSFNDIEKQTEYDINAFPMTVSDVPPSPMRSLAQDLSTKRRPQRPKQANRIKKSQSVEEVEKMILEVVEQDQLERETLDGNSVEGTVSPLPGPACHRAPGSSSKTKADLQHIRLLRSLAFKAQMKPKKRGATKFKAAGAKSSSTVTVEGEREKIGPARNRTDRCECI